MQFVIDFHKLWKPVLLIPRLVLFAKMSVHDSSTVFSLQFMIQVQCFHYSSWFKYSVFITVYDSTTVFSLQFMIQVHCFHYSSWFKYSVFVISLTLLKFLLHVI